MKKTLLCSMMLAMFGGISATQKSVTPVSAEDPMVLPYNSAELQAGTLDYEHSHLYDLICEGRCNLERKENMIPAVLHMDKIPNFVEVCKSGNNAGEIVFTTPQPMGTVTLPAGHDAYVTITLQKLKSEFEQTITDKKAGQYVALGVREQGSSDFLRILRRPYDVPAENPNEELQKKNDESVCLRMDSNNVLELVPLLSANDMLTGNYGEVKPQTVAKTWTAISALNPSDFNFGSVFRVDVACSDELPEDRREWEDMHWGTAGGYFCYANGLFLSSDADQSWVNKNYDRWVKIENSHNIRMYELEAMFYSKKAGLYICFGSNGVYTSVSGDVWEPNDTYNVSSNIVAGADCEGTFIVVSYKGDLWRLVDGETKWSDPVDSLRNLAVKDEHGVKCIAYGDGVLIAMTYNGWISRSKDKGNTWSLPEKKLEDDYGIYGLAFGEGKFLAIARLTWISTDKGQTWQVDINDAPGFSAVYDGSNFYLGGDAGEYFYRFPYINLIKQEPTSLAGGSA